MEKQNTAGTIIVQAEYGKPVVITYRNGSPDCELELHEHMVVVMGIEFVEASEDVIIFGVRDRHGVQSVYGLCRFNCATREVVWEEVTYHGVEWNYSRLEIDGDEVWVRSDKNFRLDSCYNLNTGQPV